VALPEVMAASGAFYKIDVAPFARVKEDPRSALDTLQRLLNAAVDDADRMEIQA
jgi:hypothetical protein